MVVVFFAAAPPLLAPGAMCPQDLLVVAVIEVSGELVQQFRQLQGGFVGSGGPVRWEARKIDWIRHERATFSGDGVGFDEVFASEAGPFDDDDLGVMQKPVEQRRGERRVIVEDLSPFLEWPVCCHYVELERFLLSKRSSACQGDF